MKVTSRAAAVAARVGLRRHHATSRPTGPTGRAAIGRPVEKPPQVIGEGLGVGVSAARVFLQAFQGDRLEVARHVGPLPSRAAPLRS